jgi:hypothetical protein
MGEGRIGAAREKLQLPAHVSLGRLRCVDAADLSGKRERIV